MCSIRKYFNGVEVVEGESNNKRTKLEYPYSYDPIIIWENTESKPSETSSTAHSDRLYQQDSNKYNQICKSIWKNTECDFFGRQPEEIEMFLCKYLEKKIILQKVVECCNRANGYPYWTFTFQYDI